MWTVDFLGALAFLSIRGVYVIKRPLYPASWSLATETEKQGQQRTQEEKQGLIVCQGVYTVWDSGTFKENIFKTSSFRTKETFHIRKELNSQKAWYTN